MSFEKIKPLERLTKMVSRLHYFQEIYRSPDELIADVSILLAQLEREKEKLKSSEIDCMRLRGAKDEILNDMNAAFKKFDFLFRKEPNK